MIERAHAPGRTLWGLSAQDLHARYWASRGVQVVNPGRANELVPSAELYLLADPRTLALFRLAPLLETMAWVNPTLYNVRLTDSRMSGYREEVVTDHEGKFVKFRRVYRGADHRVARIALTTDVEIAKLWQNASNVHEARTSLGLVVPRRERFAGRLSGKVYNADDHDESDRFIRDLVRDWRRPDATIERIKRVGDRVWADVSADVSKGASFVGPLWIGAGRSVAAETSAVGPSVMWDKPEARPPRGEVRWMDLEPLTPQQAVLPPVFIPPWSKLAKRSFDIAFSLVALALVLPLIPIIIAAILIEDGPPIFFSHRRETIGGREFGCLKFRSMRKDAEEIKKGLVAENQADGPQFYIENDPRLTRVGRFLRKYQLDEVPQFWNVLRGDMSVVGPRPSPYKENQFCPGWREARLSVRPGVTGLWQIRRTRVKDTDFQEWIRYDIEYVENRSFWYDISIIARTAGMVLKGFMKK
jgi:lipopolysaccharide/colanic/teichoic acid biosynthesis glycosyltransferase